MNINKIKIIGSVTCDWSVPSELGQVTIQNKFGWIFNFQNKTKQQNCISLPPIACAVSLQLHGQV